MAQQRRSIVSSCSVPSYLNPCVLLSTTVYILWCMRSRTRKSGRGPNEARQRLLQEGVRPVRGIGNSRREQHFPRVVVHARLNILVVRIVCASRYKLPHVRGCFRSRESRAPPMMHNTNVSLGLGVWAQQMRTGLHRLGAPNTTIDISYRPCV